MICIQQSVDTAVVIIVLRTDPAGSQLSKRRLEFHDLVLGPPNSADQLGRILLS